MPYRPSASVEPLDLAQVQWERGIGSGHAYVYLLPCAGEDLLKLGFTRKPMQRLRQLQPRFFNLFELDRALLLQTRSLREARRLERLLIERWPECRASPPLLVDPAAGGETEWFRGVTELALVLAARLAERYELRQHRLSDWLCDYWRERAGGLHAWAEQLWQLDELQQQLPPAQRDPRYARH